MITPEGCFVSLCSHPSFVMKLSRIEYDPPLAYYSVLVLNGGIPMGGAMAVVSPPLMSTHVCARVFVLHYQTNTKTETQSAD